MRLKTITEISIDATHWSALVNISQGVTCEPVLTEDFSNQELQDAFLNGNKLDLVDFPLHSWSVKNAVKPTSKPSHTVYGLESRQKHSLIKVLSR